MPRYCFRLTVEPHLLQEYRERHARVWPEMLRALDETGWRNYSLFCDSQGTIIGYVEADDLDRAQRAMAALEVNRRWQAQMSAFFVGLDGRPPDESFELLAEIFNLDDQLAQLGDDEAATDIT